MNGPGEIDYDPDVEQDGDDEYVPEPAGPYDDLDYEPDEDD